MTRIVFEEHDFQTESIVAVSPVDIFAERWGFQICVGSHVFTFDFTDEATARSKRQEFRKKWGAPLCY